MRDSNTSKHTGFLSGGDEMGAAIRSKEWAETPLGTPDTWSPELRTVVRLMLTTNHPIFVFWGPDLTCLYNDAYSHSLGPELHPGALGRPGREVWDEIWDIIGPQIETVMSGQGATWNEDHLVPITRNGVRDEVYWTYSYSPIDDPSAPNGVGGVLVICSETTEKVLMARKLQEELTAREVLLQEVNHRIKNSLQLVSSLLRMESRAAQTNETQNSLERASARVNAISSVHELIYRTGGFTTIHLKDYVGQLCDAIGDSLGSKSGAKLAYDVDDVEISTDMAISTALLINELVTNAFKHAFPGDKSGTIEVKVTAQQDNLTIIVADDGVGKSAGASGNLGSNIIDGLASQLSAEMAEGNDGPGHRVHFTIPIKG